MRVASAHMRALATRVSCSSDNRPDHWGVEPIPGGDRPLGVVTVNTDFASGDVIEATELQTARHISAWDPSVALAVSQLLRAVSREFDRGDWTVESDVVPTWLHSELDNLTSAYLRGAVYDAAAGDAS